jgi:tRNA A37 threonylcarbamoyladenosine dehydratase
MAERVVRIFPGCEVCALADFFTANSADRHLNGRIDCVVDAVDGVTHKCQIIAACRDRELPVVVAGGAGGKRDPAMVRVDDLAYATNDRLLKQVRKKLRREYGFPEEATKLPFGIPAVFGKENARYPWSDGRVRDVPEPGSELRLNCESGLGTASFVTGAFGLAAAAEAVKIVLAARR